MKAWISALVVILIASLALASDWGGVKAEVHDNSALIIEIRADAKATQKDIGRIRVAIERLKVLGEVE